MEDLTLLPTPVPHDGDAPGFLLVVERAVGALLARHPTEKVRLVSVDNWFGPKWLGFAAKLVGALGVWREASGLTVPPFVPNRIVGEQLWAGDPVGGYRRIETGASLHRQQPSCNNLARRIAEVAPGELVVWFSGNSARNGRGSMMAYVPQRDGYLALHAQWTASPDWVLAQVKGMARDDFAALVADAPRER